MVLSVMAALSIGSALAPASTVPVPQDPAPRSRFVGSVQIRANWGSGNGGEYRMDVLPNWSIAMPRATGTDFLGGVPAALGRAETFCLERYEGISFTGSYNADLSGATFADPANAHYASGASGGLVDPLSPETAYLFQNFIDGTLGQYSYAVTSLTGQLERIQSATSLQKAIWFLEGEISGLSDPKAVAWVQEAQGAVSSGAWSGLGSVRVLNLWRDHTGGRTNAQDVLVVIPLPSPAGMGAAALLGFVGVRRARRAG